MGRAKLPRKSTNIDMTAMCDVAFLLLSFFILTTKFKPPEAISVLTPSSVSTKAVDPKDQVIVTISKDNKVFLTIGDEAKRAEIVRDLNTRYQLQLGPADIAKAGSAEFFGSSLESLKSFVNKPKEDLKGDKLPGIPCVDSTNNQLTDWMSAVNSAYLGANLNLLVKGDNGAKYPVVREVINAFKKNNIQKFKVITAGEGVDPNTDLAKQPKKAS